MVDLLVGLHKVNHKVNQAVQLLLLCAVVTGGRGGSSSPRWGWAGGLFLGVLSVSKGQALDGVESKASGNGARGEVSK